uniref:Xylulose kinase-1 n=1 Tax=Tanacetum cinerariifolium TaxID=118510 RepID=A0A699H6J5_TANCI|nr:hypothetical protein [Tanacetum cinerariifolium]
MVNPTIYVSCIKQLWSSVSLKKTNDVVRLQALIDRRKVIIIEDSVRQSLRLDDADSIYCLPNEEIFAELARMGLVRNVYSPSKFYMYLRFLKLMINAQIADLSSHNTKYTSPALTQKVFANMRRVGKGFSRVDTPLFDGMLVPQQVHDDVDDAAENEDATNEISVEPTLPSPTPASTPPPQQERILSPSQTCATLTKKDGNLEQDKIAQATEITKLKQRVRRRIHPNRKGEIAELDANEDITLETVDADVQGRLPKSQAHVYHLDLEHTDKVLKVVTAATTINDAPLSKESAPRRRRVVIIQDPEEAATASLSVQSEVKSKDKGKAILVEEPKPLKRQAQIEQDEAYARELEAKLKANINRNEMDFFKGMTYTEIRPIFENHFNSIVAFLKKGEKEIEEEESKESKRKSESSKQKAAKKQRIDEEVEEFKTHLQIFPNDEDDVYTEATPLALKVLVVDYQIHTKHNKPYYKIIRADGTHQLFLSFTSLLRNFDREDLEMMWKIVQERFASSEPKNFSDDFLLNTLKTMFEKPNV